jgi:hypothetical protein
LRLDLFLQPEIDDFAWGSEGQDGALSEQAWRLLARLQEEGGKLLLYVAQKMAGGKSPRTEVMQLIPLDRVWD